jgi:hypothetical protein
LPRGVSWLHDESTGEREEARQLLALNACIWHNWLIGAPVKRSLIA